MGKTSSIDGKREKHSEAQLQLFHHAIYALAQTQEFSSLCQEDRVIVVVRAWRYYSEHPYYLGEKFLLVNGVFFIEMENGRLIRNDS
jgi:putative SOS response-associated peptidase YedK